MKISLLEPIGISKEKVDGLASKLLEEGHEFQYFDTKTTDAGELYERSKDSDVVMIANNPYPAEVIEKLDRLKMISVAFTGVDHVGLTACRKKNIMVCNAAGYSNQTVAELVLGMAVDAMRGVVKSDSLVRGGKGSFGVSGREICGKTVGIIGLGRIGLMCAKLFLAFGAKVIAYNRSRNPEAESIGIVYKELDQVLAESDIISLNLPLNDETRGFISGDKIALMKKNAVFINCARGPIVDNKALADALNEDKIGFACIDVFDMEPPLPADYPLLHAKNTLLTPHQAYISEEAMDRRAEIVFGNVCAWLKGEPENVIK